MQDAAASSGNTSVLLVLPSLGYGGVESGIVALANALHATGHRVTLLCGAADPAMRRRLTPGVDLDSRPFRAARHFLFPLIRKLRAEPFRAVLSTQAHLNIIVLLARMLVPRHKGRLIVQEVAQLSIGAEPGARLRHRLVRWLRRRLYARADHIVAISPDVEAGLRAELSEAATISILPVPLPVEELRRAAEAPLPDGLPTTDNGEPVIVGLGRLVRSKRFDTFLEAIALLRRSAPVQAVLIGDGPERASLEALRDKLGLGGSIRFAGHVPNAMSVLARADLLLVPSETEGFGLAALEALAVGCPVAPADYGALARDICREFYGCPPPEAGDAEKLAALARQALHSPPARAELTAFAGRFDARKVAEDYARLLFDAKTQCSRRRHDAARRNPK